MARPPASRSSKGPTRPSGSDKLQRLNTALELLQSLGELARDTGTLESLSKWREKRQRQREAAEAAEQHRQYMLDQEISRQEEAARGRIEWEKRKPKLYTLVFYSVIGVGALLAVLLAQIIYSRFRLQSSSAQNSLTNSQREEVNWIACGVRKTRTTNPKSPFTDRAMTSYLAQMCPNMGIEATALANLVELALRDIRAGNMNCDSYNPPVAGIALKNQNYTACEAFRSAR